MPYSAVARSTRSGRSPRCRRSACSSPWCSQVRRPTSPAGSCSAETGHPVRRFGLVLLVLVGLLALADRLGAVAAERVVAKRIQVDQSLAVRPDVSIASFPFLTQMVDGHYERVDVSVHDVRRGPLLVSRVVAHLYGVGLPFTDVVHQEVDRIVVDRATGEIDLDYADLNRLLSDKHLRLSEGTGGRVHVTASAGAATVDADFPLTVQGSAVVIALPAGISVQIPLPGMPFGITLKSAHADGDGIVVRCATSGFVLRT